LRKEVHPSLMLVPAVQQEQRVQEADNHLEVVDIQLTFRRPVYRGVWFQPG